MKFKFAILILVTAIPSAVWAKINFLNQDPVYVFSAQDSEVAQRPVSSVNNYKLVWNQEVGKFEVFPGNEQRPITIEETIQPDNANPQLNEPIYYGTELSV